MHIGVRGLSDTTQDCPNHLMHELSDSFHPIKHLATQRSIVVSGVNNSGGGQPRVSTSANVTTAWPHLTALSHNCQASVNHKNLIHNHNNP